MNKLSPIQMLDIFLVIREMTENGGIRSLENLIKNLKKKMLHASLVSQLGLAHILFAAHFSHWL